jgi:putative membrane protein
VIGILVRVAVNGLALYLTTLVVPELSFGADPSPAGIAGVALIFGVVNTLIKPFVKLLSLPLTIMTLGLFGLVINGGLLLLVAWLSDVAGIEFTVGGFPPDFGIDAIVWAIAGAVVLAIVSAILGLLPLPGDKR